MFEDFLTPLMPYSSFSRQGEDGLVSPRLNVVETDKAFEVEAELPGVSKEDVKVTVDDRRVLIEAESKHESTKKEGKNIVYSERSASKFARSFTLPVPVDDANAQAKLENGILTLTLPKVEATHAKQLTVR
jgi:HSP20 family protein